MSKHTLTVTHEQLQLIHTALMTARMECTRHLHPETFALIDGACFMTEDEHRQLDRDYYAVQSELLTQTGHETEVSLTLPGAGA